MYINQLKLKRFCKNKKYKRNINKYDSVDKIKQSNRKHKEVMIKDTILPDAIKRLYIINVEAAQNQLNLEEQLQTSIMLNNKFGESFKLNQSHNEFKSKVYIKKIIFIINSNFIIKWCS